VKILVTGGTGYIGSHTVVELQKSGYEVVIVDNLSNSTIGVVDQIAKISGTRPVFEKVDLSREDETIGFFRKYNDIGAVIHFAAYKAVGESVLEPLKYYSNNIMSLINVLNCMKEHCIHHLVFSSSCTVYGQPDELPVTENAAVKKALSPYGYTKQVCEHMIQDFSPASGLQAIILRYFNPIGAHDSALIGELPAGIPNNLMPYITQTAIGKRECLDVYGGDYNTPDGTAIRDYIHVVDLAKAHVIALRYLSDQKNKKPVEIFNLGTGKGYTVLEVIRSFEKMSGVSLQYKISKRRPGDIEKVWADNSRANKILNWKAERDIDDMTSSAWKWELRLKNNK